MKRAKYLLVLFVTTFVYVALSLTVGQNSMRCYRQMEDQKRIVSKQKSDIQNLNTELILELTALKNDRAVIAAYARKLDYVAEGEKLVKITGLKPANTTVYETGSVIRHVEPQYVSEKLCKIASAIAGLILFVFMLMGDVKNGNISFKKNYTTINGIPVYDVPQI